MADIELVIRMHEKDYQSVLNGCIPFCVLDAIANGVVKKMQETKTETLDKIRAEIEQMNSIDYVKPATVDEVLEIIDKYRTESENKE